MSIINTSQVEEINNIKEILYIKFQKKNKKKNSTLEKNGNIFGKDDH